MLQPRRAVLWLRQLVASLSPMRHGFAPASIHVGFVVDSGTGTEFSLSSSFSPVNIIHPELRTHTRISSGG
jgi:hypothetical protein